MDQETKEFVGYSIVGVLILLVLYICYVTYYQKDDVKSTLPDTSSTTATTTPKVEGMKRKRENLYLESSMVPEMALLNEQQVYGDITKEMPDDLNELAEHEDKPFNASGESYGDFVTALAIDPQTIENQREFVKDLPKHRAVITGRTGGFGGDGLGYINNWVGIRGPHKRVPVGNPKQINEYEDSDYEGWENNVFNMSKLSQYCEKPCLCD